MLIVAKKMAKISLTVPEEVLEEFKKYCEIERRSVSAQVSLLMEKAVKESKEDG